MSLKTIIFIRHAKSSWDDLSLTDKRRPLNVRGKRDAPLMAKLLQGLYPNIDGCLVSSSERTRQTIKYFKEVYNWPKKKILYFDQLYHGYPADYQNVLFECPDTWDTVIMVGHNPGITDVANDCIHDGYIDNVPTTGIFVLQTDADSWSEVILSRCKRVAFYIPKGV